MTNKRWRILVVEKLEQDAVERLRAVGDVTTVEGLDEQSIENAVADCDAMVVRTYGQVTRRVMESAPGLKVIGRAGVGLENIDVEAARRRGIPVVYTPAAATDAVADLTLGLMISVLRQIPLGDDAVRTGRFREVREQVRCRELAELTLGIIGLGRIGSAVARRCSHGFHMPVLYNDIVPPGPLDFPATSAEKERLYREADVISLHVPLTTLTRHLINEKTLSLFKPTAILINTARGSIVDSPALARHLSAGKLAGAGLDVVEPEPLSPDHPLLSAPNLLLTPHFAARTHGGLRRMNDVVDDVIRVLQGKPPLYPAWT